MFIKNLFLALSFIILVACAPKATMSPQPMETNKLLRDLKKEKCNSSECNLSAEFIEKYNLKYANSTYYVDGFLRVKSETKADELTQYGLLVGTQIDSMWTVQVPVQHLESLLSNKSVQSFECGKKAQMRKSGNRQ